MNRLIGAAALVLATWPAAAADIQPYGKAPTPVASAYNWSGPYFGMNLGYLWGTATTLRLAPQGWAGGVQAGYNWQVGQVVFGGEADLQVAGADDMFAPFKFSNPWFGSVRGRAGYALDNVLLYATAGLAYGAGRLEIPGLRETQVHFGWAGGGGIEVGLTPNWSVKAEYLFIGLSDKTYVVSGISSGIDSHLVRTGVSYRF
jgi:outer membrane immunogenic protein